MSEAKLRDELRSAIPGLEEHTTITLEVAFADLLWDGDMTIDEAFALDPVVVLDALDSYRRLVIQRVRGQLRYWLASDRRPSELKYDELGWLDSFDSACLLIEELLFTDTPAHELKTPRSCGSRRF